MIDAACRAVRCRGVGLLFCFVAWFACSPASAQSAPAADHHQHLFSPAVSQLFGRSAAESTSFDAADLIALLDVAGIRRAVVLSVAYLFGSPARSIDDVWRRSSTRACRPKPPNAWRD